MSQKTRAPTDSDAGPSELAEQQLDAVTGGGVIAPERAVKLRNLLRQMTSPEPPAVRPGAVGPCN